MTVSLSWRRGGVIDCRAIHAARGMTWSDGTRDNPVAMGASGPLTPRRREARPLAEHYCKYVAITAYSFDRSGGSLTTTAEGAVRRIVRYGEPVLHRRCAPVTDFGASLSALIDDMFATMYAANGAGLAANQIGVDARVFVLDCRDADGVKTIAHVVNPTLLEAQPPRELMVGPEGCLSVPGPYLETSRVATATVTGFDKTGAPITVSGTGTLARCLQHETDHLDGVVYLDRLPKRMRNQALAEAGLSPR
jgi:peptide deformylase